MANDRNLGALARKSRVIPLPNGTHAEVRALTLADFALIQEEAAHARKRDLIETYARNAEFLPKNLREQMLVDAFKRAENIRPDTLETADVQAWLKTKRGQLIAIWASMRGAQPNLTYDEAAVIWSIDMEAVQEAAETVGELSRPTLGNEQPPLATGEPKPQVS